MNEEKREQLKKIIEELANDSILSNKKNKNNYYYKLKKIYTGKNGELLRHYYSDIFQILTKIKNNNKNIISVGTNLKLIYDLSLSKQDKEFSNIIRKLYDHTNLEIARIEYVTSIDTKLDLTGEGLQDKYNRIEKQAQKIVDKQNSVENTVKRVEGIYSEFVSILGIFSAIVLVYFGGTSILGNAISSLKETFILKSILICLIAGLIVFDIIFMFFYFLSKILDKSIAATYDYIAYYNIIDRFKIRYPIIYFVNLLFLSAIIGDIVCWLGYATFTKPYLFNNIQMFMSELSENMRTVLLIAFISFNIIYFSYYLFCKITDKLIGSYVNIKYTHKYRIERDEDKYNLYDTFFNDFYKRYDNHFTALLVLFYKNYIIKVADLISNTFSRIFVRHKIFSCINIFFLFLYILLNKLV